MEKLWRSGVLFKGLVWTTWAAVVLGCCVVSLSWGQQTASSPEDSSEEQKPPFELRRWSTLPADLQRVMSFYKEGHWGMAILEAVSREENLTAAELVSEPIELFGSPYRLILTRPVNLAQGSAKRLELPLFLTRLPNPNRGSSGASAFQNTISITWHLRHRRSGQPLAVLKQPVVRMPRYQFMVVVLASDPDRYRFLEVMRWPEPMLSGSFVSSGEQSLTYRLVFPVPGRYVPVPSHPLAWTGIAYVIWDGIDPENFSAAQQEALIDWLHWGGHLILVAPDTLSLLRGSFLEPWLPAQAGPLIQLEPDELEVLNQWTLDAQPRFHALAPWTVVQLEVEDHPQVKVLLRSAKRRLPLVVERRVGRGRVVVVGFSLAQRELLPQHWPQVDHFINSCLLRLPGRSFPKSQQQDRLLPFQSPDHQVWSDQQSEFWARRFTPLRLFARDTLHDPPWNESGALVLETTAGTDPLACPEFSTLLAGDWMGDQVLEVKLQDIPRFSLSYQAREILREGSGIEVPSGRFVLTFLGVYVVILVPVNWLVFRLLGRLEWAWAAMVPITLIAAGAVIRLAQLNIGFARSWTEVAVVEAQPQAPRAHVTRFVSLYASLGTTYTVHFSTPAAMAVPLPDPQAAQLAQQRGQFGFVTGQDVRFYWDGATCRLEGFFVPSNSVGLLRCEYMAPLSGSCSWEAQEDGWILTNNTPWHLQEGILLTPQEQGAWVASLAPGEQVPVKQHVLRPLSQLEQEFGIRTIRLGELRLNEVLQLVLRWHRLHPDAYRLVAWGTEVPAGMQISPSVAQHRKAVLYLFHLQYEPFGPPELDKQPVVLRLLNEDPVLSEQP